MAVSCPEVMYGAYYPYLYGRGAARSFHHAPHFQYDRFNVQSGAGNVGSDAYGSGGAGVSSGSASSGAQSPGSPPHAHHAHHASRLRAKEEDLSAHGRASADAGGSSESEGECAGSSAARARAQYVSANCVVFTHYSGDVAAVVDEHFARALSLDKPKEPVGLGTARAKNWVDSWIGCASERRDTGHSYALVIRSEKREPLLKSCSKGARATKTHNFGIGEAARLCATAPRRAAPRRIPVATHRRCKNTTDTTSKRTPRSESVPMVSRNLPASFFNAAAAAGVGAGAACSGVDLYEYDPWHQHYGGYGHAAHRHAAEYHAAAHVHHNMAAAAGYPGLLLPRSSLHHQYKPVDWGAQHAPHLDPAACSPYSYPSVPVPLLSSRCSDRDPALMGYSIELLFRVTGEDLNGGVWGDSGCWNGQVSGGGQPQGHHYAPEAEALDNGGGQRYMLLRLLPVSVEFDLYLEFSTATTPKRELLLIMGYFNAKMGETTMDDGNRNIVGRYGLGVRNNRGDRLIEFEANNNLTIMNTTHTQDADCESDHELLVGKLGLKLQRSGGAGAGHVQGPVLVLRGPPPPRRTLVRCAPPSSRCTSSVVVTSDACPRDGLAPAPALALNVDYLKYVPFILQFELSCVVNLVLTELCAVWKL
ncbi:unnamed protein product [Arctia plantaginis]|uniref:Protein vestigial n=1 Tax=Arctia plantaginis TaxID=874455 RepID=A0A8S1AZA4_ARCPL|nr:unnamed protein product [Arctia plantaginis]